MPLHVIPDLNATNDPEAFMVYEQSARGGTCLTLFTGTEAACEEFVKQHPSDVPVSVDAGRAKDQH